MNDIFDRLYAVDVGPFVTYADFGFGMVPYLEWATAWKLLKQQYPQAESVIHTNAKGLPYFSDDLGVFVHVSIKIDELIVSDWYPVEKKDHHAGGIQTAHQRALVKVCGRLGLGLKLWEEGGRKEIEDSRKPISAEQRRIFADKATELGWTVQEVKELLRTHGYESSAEILLVDFENLCRALSK